MHFFFEKSAFFLIVLLFEGKKALLNRVTTISKMGNYSQYIWYALRASSRKNSTSDSGSRTRMSVPWVRNS